MLSARAIATRVAAGTSIAKAEVAVCKARINAREPEISAFAALVGRPKAGTGPLAGIGFGAKDIIDTADLPTGMGSAVYAGWQPRADAPLVMACRRAGATLMGKTHTTAFAFLDPAPTRNPHDLTATPGGSSAGSAAAVASGMLPLALGTQTGGSVIRPASYCGVAGIKPSYGILPTVGIKCFSWSLDTPGLFAGSADDLAFALAAITGRSELDPPAISLKGLRLGIERQAFAGPPEPASAAMLDHAISVARAAGAILVEMPESEVLGQAFNAHGPVQDFEAAQALAWEWHNHRAALPPKLAAYLESAQAVTAAQYDTGRKFARRGRDAMRGYFEPIDAVLSCSAPGEAPAGLGSTGDSRFNRLWTLMGTPCVTIPAMRGPRGLPVGLQIIARFGRDEAALAVGIAMEKALAASALA
ncbi:MAG: amidase [Bosea sp. (in: a-proteobacteria)]